MSIIQRLFLLCLLFRGYFVIQRLFCYSEVISLFRLLFGGLFYRGYSIVTFYCSYIPLLWRLDSSTPILRMDQEFSAIYESIDSGGESDVDDDDDDGGEYVTVPAHPYLCPNQEPKYPPPLPPSSSTTSHAPPQSLAKKPLPGVPKRSAPAGSASSILDPQRKKKPFGGSNRPQLKPKSFKYSKMKDDDVRANKHMHSKGTAPSSGPPPSGSKKSRTYPPSSSNKVPLPHHGGGVVMDKAPSPWAPPPPSGPPPPSVPPPPSPRQPSANEVEPLYDNYQVKEEFTRGGDNNMSGRRLLGQERNQLGSIPMKRMTKNWANTSSGSTTDSLESGNPGKRRTGCILLAITLVSVLIALASLATALYSISSVTMQSRRAGTSCFSSVTHYQSNKTESQELMIANQTLQLYRTILYLPDQRTSGRDKIASVTCSISGLRPYLTSATLVRNSSSSFEDCFCQCDCMPSGDDIVEASKMVCHMTVLSCQQY